MFIADIVYQALVRMTCSHAAMEYHSITSINSMYRFRIQLPTEIQPLVAQLLAKNRFTCHTNICKVNSKFPSCLIIVLTINLEVQV